MDFLWVSVSKTLIFINNLVSSHRPTRNGFESLLRGLFTKVLAGSEEITRDSASSLGLRAVGAAVLCV